MAIVVTALAGAFLIVSVVLIVRRRARLQRHLSRVKPDLIDKDEDYEIVQYPSNQDHATENTPLALDGEHDPQRISSSSRYISTSLNLAQS